MRYAHPAWIGSIAECGTKVHPGKLVQLQPYPLFKTSSITGFFIYRGVNMKTINTRIQMKRDTSENWNKVITPPLEGELLIYLDNNGNNIKIGDGKTLPKDLPFASINELFFNTEV